MLDPQPRLAKDEENLGMFTTKAMLKKGDRIYFASNGGGGYGLPWERKAESVLEDVIDELLSLEKARDVYGVAIEASRRRRARVRDRRGRDGAACARSAGRADERPRGTATVRGQPARRGAVQRPRGLGTSEGGASAAAHGAG